MYRINLQETYWPSGSSYGVIGMFEYALSAAKSSHQDGYYYQSFFQYLGITILHKLKIFYLNNVIIYVYLYFHTQMWLYACMQVHMDASMFVCLY